jgi:hypothetical protein
LADHPDECPVCNSVTFAVQCEQWNYQHETRVHTASFESQHVSSTFYVRCHSCGNQWCYTVPAHLRARSKATFPIAFTIRPTLQPADQV